MSYLSTDSGGDVTANTGVDILDALVDTIFTSATFLLLNKHGQQIIRFDVQFNFELSFNPQGFLTLAVHISSTH